MKKGDDPYADISLGYIDRLTEWAQRQLGLIGPAIPATTPVESVVDENGLATKANMGAFIGRMQILAAGWSGLTPSTRKSTLLAIINETLESNGVPGVKLKFRGGKARGSFSASAWTIKLNKKLVDVGKDSLPNPAQLASTFYHEARHAEQKYLIVRMLAGAGWKAAQITRHTGLPAKVVKAGVAAPITEEGSQKKLAELCYHTQYGAHRDRRSKILKDKKKYLKELRAARKELKELQAKDDASDKALEKARKKVTTVKAQYKAAYAGYKTFPNEVDAWRVGGIIKDAYTDMPDWVEEAKEKL